MNRLSRFSQVTGVVCLCGLAAAVSWPSGPRLAVAGDGEPPGVSGKESVQEQASKAVGVRLVSDNTALVPGRPGFIALTFEIAKGWHLYWRNPGDSGSPIRFNLSASDGIRVGGPIWPVPERKVSPGDILDYVYERRVTLIFPIEVSASLPRSGATAVIKADVEWLVCREACVPGARSLELRVPIETESTMSPEAGLFESARQRHAAPIAPPGPGGGGGKPRTRWDGLELIVERDGAKEMVFYPYESEAAQPPDMVERGRADGPKLSVRYPESAVGSGRVRAALEVHDANSVTFHLIDVAAPTGG